MPKKILLADDSITIQKVISITLGGEDCDLTVVGDGESAVRKAVELKPEIILADISMPGKNGYEVCEAVKKDPALSHISVMLLAGTFEPLNKAEAIRVGADDSIVKPFESQELIEKVNNLIEATRERLRQGKAERGGHEAGITEPLAQPPPAVPPFKPESSGVSENIWEAGDFLGFPEEEASAKETKEIGSAPDLGFLEGGFLEEPEAAVTSPQEKAFVDLEFGEDFSAKEEVVEPKSRPSFEFNADDFSLESFEIKKEAEPESFAVEPVELLPEPFEIEEKKAADVLGAPWGGLKDEAIESNAIEAPAGPATEEALSPGKAKEPLAEPLAPVEARRPEPEKVEKARPGKEPPPQQSLSALQMPEVSVSQFSGIIDKAVASAAKNIKEDLISRINAGEFIQRDELKGMIEGISRTIVQEVAWEVIPELAEEMIRAEINRIREAISKFK